MINRSYIAIILAILIFIVTGALTHATPPSLPASFYGTVKLNGADVAANTYITAWIDGVRYAEAPISIVDGDSVYVVDVPSDDLNTQSVEGGRDGDTITFKLDDFNIEQTATWTSGAISELNLTVSPLPVARFSSSKGLNVAQLEDGASIADFSSVFSDFAGYQPENAIDYSTSANWLTGSGQVTDQWIKVALIGEQRHVVDRVILGGTSNNVSLKDFEVRVSTTGVAETDFTTVLTGTVPQDSKLHEFTFDPVQARYVQLFIKNNHGGSYIQVNHFQVWTRDRQGGIVSLREGPPASIVAASSQCCPANAPEKAIDEIPGSAWFPTQGQTANEWFKVELGGGRTYTIDRVRLQTDSAMEGARDFEIRVSTTITDDAAFTTVFSGTAAATTDLQEFVFAAPVEARYVQLFVHNNHGSNFWIRVNTFQVLTSDGANVARLEGVGAFVVDFSSQWNTSSGPEQAIGFDANPVWLSGTGQVTNQWLKIRLIQGGPYLVDRIKLQGLSGGQSPKDFEIGVSNATHEDADFISIFKGTLPSDGQVHWVTFPPVAAKYVRLFIFNNHGSDTFISLRDFESFRPS
ncbi:discoidin domain-containing protein [Chloroflexi bacterium TSY]|nr:discoidin domain-containing protein [Chloroflexi bacterium TSY]